jgi:predicted nucleic acid-binding Zn ribbon protein
VPWQPLPGSRPDEPERVTSALDRVVRHLGAPSVDALDTLYRRWDELAGPSLATHTRPIALRDGALVVAVHDPAWATQVRFLEPQLLDRIAAELGAAAPTRLEVRVRPPNGA